MDKQKQIKVIPLGKLIAHPANPNRMAKSSFSKLVSHIRTTGNYEPVIVRVHPEEKGAWQILNGHHRVKALKTIEAVSADCVVWEVDDGQAMVLLMSLNRLCGRDDLQKKSELMKSLTKRFDVKQLVKMLPESAKSIKNLSSLATVTRLEGFRFNPDLAEQTLKEHFGVSSLKGFGAESLAGGIAAAGALVGYLQSNRVSSLDFPIPSSPNSVTVRPRPSPRDDTHLFNLPIFFNQLCFSLCIKKTRISADFFERRKVRF